MLDIAEMRAAALAIVEDRIENENIKMDMLLRGEHPEPRRWWYIFYDPRRSLRYLRVNTRMELIILQYHRRVLTLGDDPDMVEIASKYVYPNDFNKE